ncbi:hypothetical protein MNBD_ALPHA07-1250 [hydrothermal vent metagenome]|uniref:Uncharacterized protein n=1 Tax=hydrothermal vent metagenome TaxID=652676 RepID=A0A3B0TAG9_9ZZZZ
MEPLNKARPGILKKCQPPPAPRRGLLLAVQFVATLRVFMNVAIVTDEAFSPHPVGG